MRFYPIPQFMPASELFMPILDKELAEFRNFTKVPTNIAYFASTRTVNGALPNEGVGVKPFRDNAAVYKNQETFDYIVQRGEVNLKLRSVPSDAGTITTDAEGLGELNLYPYSAIKFYNERFLKSGGKEFARIPKLVKITVSREEARRLNVVTTVPVPVEWPLAIFTGDGHVPTTLNPDFALRFHNGGVEAFSVTDYDREFPLVVGSMGDQELLDTVSAILGDVRMSVEEKARAIRLVAK